MGQQNNIRRITSLMLSVHHQTPTEMQLFCHYVCTAFDENLRNIEENASGALRMKKRKANGINPTKKRWGRRNKATFFEQIFQLKETFMMFYLRVKGKETSAKNNIYVRTQ